MSRTSIRQLACELADASESRDRVLLEEIRARKTSPEMLSLAAATDRLLLPVRLPGAADRRFVSLASMDTGQVQ